MRPTGPLHLGHLVGALKNWVALQDEYDCVFSIADWHAYMGEYEQSKSLKAYIHEMTIDWLACGLDPDKSILFVQSRVPEHLELQMIFSCITPLGWLERNPTYKEQLREISTRDLQAYGFLGYPVLQAADILLYKASAVPIGEDQLPHLELTREISRRFNHINAVEYFQDCDAILTETPRLLGVDGRKMSKSYNNAINLSDPQGVVLQKVRAMITDPQRVRLNDPGRPDKCNVFDYFKIFSPEQTADVCDWCTQAKKGCTDCKKILSDALMVKLQPLQEKRKALEGNPDTVEDVLRQGEQKARVIAQKTIKEVKDIIF